MSAAIKPRWLVSACRAGAAMESIEITAWDRNTVVRAAISLGYSDIQACKKLRLGINEFRRLHGHD